jgi:Na+/phosphate symporter
LFSKIDYINAQVKLYTLSTLTDEQLAMQEIRQIILGIKSQDIEQLRDIFASDISDEIGYVRDFSSAETKIKNCFTKSFKRKKHPKYNYMTPQVKGIKPTWDFEIEVTKIKSNKNKITVNCDVMFITGIPVVEDTTNIILNPVPNRLKEKLEFEKNGEEIKLKKVQKLFKYLEDLTDISQASLTRPNSVKTNGRIK